METDTVKIHSGIDLNILQDGEGRNNIFSVYKKPITNLIPHQEVTTLDVYKVIVSDKYKSVTEKLRSANGQSQNFKASELDYATFSGTFTKRTAASLKQHSGLICIDIDHLENVRKIKECVLKDYIPELMFISPSGNGLKLVYRINVSTGSHTEYFNALQVYFNQQLNIAIDPSGKDVSRACFLPHDPGCQYSNIPTIFDKYFLDTFCKVNEPAKVVPQLSIPKIQAGNKIDIAFNMVNNAIDGEKHLCLLKASKLMGGYIASEEVDEQAAINALEAAIKNRNIDSFQAAQKTIRAGIEHGKKEPIYSNSYNSHANKLIETAIKKDPKENIPLLPIDGLPDFLQKLITECSEVYGTHRDFWAGAFLSSTALAIGQTHELKSKYENASILWMAIVAPSGIGKTEPLDFAFNPFHKMDGAAITDHERLLSEYEAIKAMGKEERKEAGYNAKQPMPVCKQYILSDATPEAVISANKNNERGINILRDELHGWLLDFGRYSKSGEVQNWLSAWSGKPMTVNRKGSSPIKIQNPFINITGGLQPDIIPELAKDHRAVNGFMQRFCFVYPDEVVRPDYRSNEISETLKQQYLVYINRLLSSCLPQLP